MANNSFVRPTIINIHWIDRYRRRHSPISERSLQRREILFAENWENAHFIVFLLVGLSRAEYLTLSRIYIFYIYIFIHCVYLLRILHPAGVAIRIGEEKRAARHSGATRKTINSEQMYKLGDSRGKHSNDCNESRILWTTRTRTIRRSWCGCWSRLCRWQWW